MDGLPISAEALVVLDTNVLLDWLVFDDPRVAGLVAAVESGTLRWIATPAMRNEFDAVVDRGLGPRWPADADRAWRAWDRHARMRAAPVASLATPRCRDPNDQMFIDLAVVAAARFVVSRDRAVLALRRRLANLGVEVATPERWGRSP